MPLLEVHKLTMRFGGLTAVSDVDLDVPKDSIFSVIGPNGAGKTTVFNAITGIYNPTAGTIRCNGSDLRRPLTWRVVLACLAIGIITSIAALLLALDINQLWRAVIVRNMQDPKQPFTYAQAWSDFRGYMTGRLAVERSPSGKWAVVPWNGSRPILALAADHEFARKIAARLDKVVYGDASLGQVANSTGVLQVLADRRTIAEIAAAGELQSRTEWVATILGLILGSAGSFAIWSRSRRTPDVIAGGGIARTFQNIRLLSSMTVLENVQVGIDRRLGISVRQWLIAAVIWIVVFGSLALAFVPTLLPLVAIPPLAMFAAAQWQKRRDERESARLAYDVLGVVGLQSRASSLAGSLAYGQQRRLEIGRALALKPRLILLDEPAAGMNPTESADLMRLIRGIRDRGVTVMLIEHHMNVVMGISDRIAVLDHGVKIAEGNPAEVRANPKVIAAYLGPEIN